MPHPLVRASSAVLRDRPADTWAPVQWSRYVVGANPYSTKHGASGAVALGPKFKGHIVCN